MVYHWTQLKNFKTSLALQASNWMQSLLREFDYKSSKDFWKTYNRLCKKNTGNFGPIRTRINLHARIQRLPTNFEKFFFESKNLSTQKFDGDHHEYVKRENSVNSNYNEHNDDFFEDEIPIPELEQALKELPPTGSFEIDTLHILILKHLGSRAKVAVLHLLNKCWAECN